MLLQVMVGSPITVTIVFVLVTLLPTPFPTITSKLVALAGHLFGGKLFTTKLGLLVPLALALVIIIHVTPSTEHRHALVGFGMPPSKTDN
jgi:hypothetical protein